MSYDVWQIELRHDGLKKYRIVRGRDRYIVEQKAAALKASWEEMWEKKIAREAAVKEKEDNKQLALERTQEAESKIDEVKNILQHTININDAINWDSLLDKSEYPKSPPERPKPLLVPIEPIKSDRKFKPKVNFFISFFPKWEEKKIKESVELFMREHSNWQGEKQRIEEENSKSMEEYKKSLQKWEDEKKLYIEKRENKNKAILEKKEKYFDKDFNAIIEYCDMVLSNSEYPDTFPQVYDIGYNPETRILLLDYYLPSKEDIPTLKEVKYIILQNKFKEIYISESELNNLYDDILYQITLRTIHELYEADVINAIASIIFNGYVKFIDKGTGKEITSCILSIQAEREEFLSINLKEVDPKTCFKTLKGIGSSKLHGLASIAPIMQLNKEDKRFVSPYTVIDSIDNVTNIAAMDWQDFENLIRELFEKEFAPQGGEVKITRVSRDEGVDAVIFDPDPLRGGKIVIQAKRYTNVVGVSAVRDLYGTVLNEGAMKGILVTTADYGPDAYKFAQDKPITLLNGSNLLHLLEKHGHRAKIDIKEAKKILIEKEREIKNGENRDRF